MSTTSLSLLDADLSSFEGIFVKSLKDGRKLSMIRTAASVGGNPEVDAGGNCMFDISTSDEETSGFVQRLDGLLSGSGDSGRIKMAKYSTACVKYMHGNLTLRVCRDGGGKKPRVYVSHHYGPTYLFRYRSCNDILSNADGGEMYAVNTYCREGVSPLCFPAYDNYDCIQTVISTVYKFTLGNAILKVKISKINENSGGSGGAEGGRSTYNICTLYPREGHPYRKGREMRGTAESMLTLLRLVLGPLGTK